MTLPELFANNFQTTLAASCGSGDSTINVANGAPSALQAFGQFRILVDTEYMLVTGGANGTSWTVTRGVEGSSAAAHQQGATVTHILTAGALTSGFAQVGNDGTIGGPGGTALSSAIVTVMSAGPISLSDPNGNVGIGWEVGAGLSLGQNTTGIHNTAIGADCLPWNTTGTHNTGLGEGALAVNISGSYNTALGNDALTNSATGSESTAVGTSALLNSKNGPNTALGRAALISCTTGTGNTALGYKALYNSTQAGGNTAVGHQALFATTSGTALVAVGNLALFNNTTGSGNTAVGQTAMASVTTGIFNTALGNNAMAGLISGHENVAIGHNALHSAAGANNTAIGSTAGYSALGSGNVFIGYQAGYNETGSNKLYIDNTRTSSPLIGGDFAARTVAFGTKNMGFFGAAPAARPVAGAVTSGYAAGSNTAVTIDGTFTGNLGATAYTIGDLVAALKNLGLITL